jgi:hypothetical protein
MKSVQRSNCVSLIKKKITVKLVFGVAQAVLAFAYIVLALFLKFNVFNVQSSLSSAGAREVLNFYVSILLTLGVVLVVGGFFLVYDWWESR